MSLHSMSLVMPTNVTSSQPISFAQRVQIISERACDIAARERLLDDAFGVARFGKTCERLREGRLPANGLSLVALDDGRVVGTVRLWHVTAGGVPALMLGPLAVAKTHRSLGLGSKLMGEALCRALVRGHKAVILVGDAPYYAPFGFEPQLTQSLQLPGPVDLERFLGLEIEPGALAQARGSVVATGARDLSAQTDVAMYKIAA